MRIKTKSIARLSAFTLSALLLGLPATAALADEPTSVPEAQAKAQHYQEQAAYYRALGGVGYKTGGVQAAEADAAKYAALTDQLSNPAVAVPSPEAQHYADLAARYRAMGGAGYKTGAVQRAEAEQQKHEAGPIAGAPMTQASSPSCAHTKPAVMTSCRR
jgi:hypothetical protein